MIPFGAQCCCDEGIEVAYWADCCAAINDPRETCEAPSYGYGYGGGRPRAGQYVYVALLVRSSAAPDIWWASRQALFRGVLPEDPEADFDIELVSASTFPDAAATGTMRYVRQDNRSVSWVYLPPGASENTVETKVFSFSIYKASISGTVSEGVPMAIFTALPVTTFQRINYCPWKWMWGPQAAGYSIISPNEGANGNNGGVWGSLPLYEAFHIPFTPDGEPLTEAEALALRPEADIESAAFDWELEKTLNDPHGHWWNGCQYATVPGTTVKDSGNVGEVSRTIACQDPPTVSQQWAGRAIAISGGIGITQCSIATVYGNDTRDRKFAYPTNDAATPCPNTTFEWRNFPRTCPVGVGSELLSYNMNLSGYGDPQQFAYRSMPGNGVLSWTSWLVIGYCGTGCTDATLDAGNAAGLGGVSGAGNHIGSYSWQRHAGCLELVDDEHAILPDSEDSPDQPPGIGPPAVNFGAYGGWYINYTAGPGANTTWDQEPLEGSCVFRLR